MKKTKYTEEQIIAAVKQMEAGRPVKDLARELGVTDQTLYNWKSKFSGMDICEAERLKSLEDENRRLKEIVAGLSLDKRSFEGRDPKNGWGCAGTSRYGVEDERALREKSLTRKD
jgi:putative transposase